MVALYDATGGPGWTDHSNWLTDAPLGEWSGVTKLDKCVFALTLVRNRLSGEMPAELGNLRSLNALDLSGNRLTGEVPAGLANLGGLSRLNLSSNPGLVGEIPPEVCALPNLRRIDVSGTELAHCKTGPSQADRPDLVVDAVTTDESNPHLGAEITLTATVRNQGDSGTSFGSVRLYWFATEFADPTVEEGSGGPHALTTIAELGPGRSVETSRQVWVRRAGDGAYYHAVCVEPVRGESDETNNCATVAITPKSGPGVPLAPSWVKVIGRTSDYLTIQYRRRPDADNQLHRSLSPDDGFLLVAADLEGEIYYDDAVQPGTIYYYRMRACNHIGCSDLSRAVAGVTEAVGTVDVPAVPVGVIGTKIKVSGPGDKARVAWNPVRRATYYEVYQGDTKDAELDATITHYVDPEPNRGAIGAFLTTTYAVKACNKAGCSELSDEITVR